jgi:hypothetical protein
MDILGVGYFLFFFFPRDCHSCTAGYEVIGQTLLSTKGTWVQGDIAEIRDQERDGQGAGIPMFQFVLKNELQMILLCVSQKSFVPSYNDVLCFRRYQGSVLTTFTWL